MVEKKKQDYRLTRSLMNVTVAVVCEKDIHIPDLLTKVRVLPSIAVVGQVDKVMRTEIGDTIVDIFVKFLPVSSKRYENIISVCELIKSLPGVMKVKVIELDGKIVKFHGAQIVI